LAEVVELVAAGRIKPIVTDVCPLEEAEMLHQRLRKQEILGRVVLEP
jgi:NADPH:quinone reductase-like Zn-dependent oxidoreductase